MDKRILVSRILLIWHILLLVSIVFSFRAISSLSIGLIIITSIYHNKVYGTHQQTHKLVATTYFAFALYFFWQFSSLVYSGFSETEWKEIQLKSGLLFAPLAVIFSKSFYDNEKQNLKLIFVILVAIAGLYLLVSAGMHFFTTGETNVFFYHDLTASLSQHAVYFSFLVFLSLVILLEYKRKLILLPLPALKISIGLFLSLVLLLLSSKLFISIYLVYLTHYILRKKQPSPKRKGAWLLAISALVTFLVILFTTHNTISRRFREIVNGNLTLIQKKDFDPAQYFNGLQFRLLQWKLVPVILTEKKAWVMGVGNENAQLQLNEQYKKLHMYAGQPGTEDKGYMQYNTHNQFLESLLRNGLVGLLLLTLLFMSLFQLCLRQKKSVLTACVIALLCFSFTESLLETQYGVLFLSFFPFWLTSD